MTVRGWLVPRVVFPLYERLSGHRFWTELRRLRELQWRSPEELEARALRRLRPLLAHAYSHVPYYRDLFDRAAVRPDDIRAVSDLARVPLSGKAELRANFPARVLADNLSAHRRVPAVTSGSTGLPFAFYLDRASIGPWWGSHLFFWEWAGVAAGQPAVQLVISLRLPQQAASSPGLIGAARRFVLGAPFVILSGLDLAAAELRAEVGRVAARSEYVIWGLPSYIARLAVGLLERGSALPRAPIAVIASGETLTATDAAVIGRAFRCRVVNHYSSREVLHLGQTCPDEPGLLHVNSERALLRVVREDGTAAALGEPGRVALTDLANRVMPLVNYDIGDRAVAGGPCPCGRGFPTLASLEGRAGERIRTPGGKLITPHALGWLLTDVLHALPYVWEYQAVQTAADAVVVRVVPTRRFTPERARALEEGLADYLGPGMGVRVETAERIAVEPSGKRLIIKSEPPPP